MKEYCLFIDESGSGNPRVKKSPCYIVCGCLVPEFKRLDLKIRADQIKFKYWGRTSVVFHSREIGRKERDFRILKNRKIYQDFCKDLLSFLSSSGVQLFIVVVDYEQAVKLNWNSQKVYKETAAVIVRNFILSLLALGDVKGRLVIESATAEKDFIFHKTAGYFLSGGLPHLNVTHKAVQGVLTEVSFVTKKNHDIEEQIADLFSYAAKLKFLKKKKDSMTAYEQELVKIMNQKLFHMHPETGIKKKKYYSQIEEFKVVP